MVDGLFLYYSKLINLSYYSISICSKMDWIDIAINYDNFSFYGIER